MTNDENAELIEVGNRFYALLAQARTDRVAVEATLAQLQGVRAELAATQASLAQVRDDTHADGAAHKERMFQAKAQHERAMHEGRMELSALAKAIPEAEAELASANAAVADALARHQFVEAKIEAFKKDIGGARPAP
jgi:chromosome segregation ATPase